MVYIDQNHVTISCTWAESSLLKLSANEILGFLSGSQAFATLLLWGQGVSTCECKIWAQINLWRVVDLKKNECGLAWFVLLSTRIRVITVVRMTTVTIRIVVDKSTNQAKPHFQCFLPRYQRQRNCFPERELREALCDTSTRAVVFGR